MKLKAYTKRRPGGGAKGIQAKSAGAQVTDEQLAKINRFSLSPLTAEEVYARKYLIAHNMIDRDGERFSEDLLDDFARTFPGKGYLFSHNRGDFFPLGLIFDASTENMSAEQFKTITGEDPRLPDGMDSVKVVWAWFYIPRTESSADMIKNIEAGIYRHGSIGFTAADLVPVKGAYEQTLYWEYLPPGEAREASLVWLGAQHGATTQKQPKNGENSTNTRGGEGEDFMNILKALLGKVLGKKFGEDVTEEQIVRTVESVLVEKDGQIKTLETEKAELSFMAEIGRKYRKKLTDNYVRMKTALGECAETEEAGTRLKTLVEPLHVDFLEGEVRMLEERMAEKFPAQGQLKGDMRRDRSADGAGGGADADNVLIPS